MNAELHYPDGDSISDYAKNATLYCQTTGSSEDDGGVFAPKDEYPRRGCDDNTRFVEIVLG